jgi:Arc/MetJ-type ribon-helix-helix transcriptional regulator
MTRSAIPDPRDESLRDRETVRLPRSTTEDIDKLVDEGKYPNRSAFLRAGARLLIACEREDVWPALGRGQDDGADSAPDGPGSLQEMAEADANDEGEAPPAAADGGIAGAVDLEMEGEAIDETGDDEYEFVAESPAVSEADIVTKLSTVMRDATAGERAAAAS